MLRTILISGLFTMMLFLHVRGTRQGIGLVQAFTLEVLGVVIGGWLVARTAQGE